MLNQGLWRTKEKGRDRVSPLESDPDDEGLLDGRQEWTDSPDSVTGLCGSGLLFVPSASVGLFSAQG